MEAKAKIWLGALLLGLVLIAAMLVFPQSLGLSKSGFDTEDTLRQFFFYAFPGIGFLLGILLGKTIEFFIIKGDDKYGNSVAFSSQGELPSIPFFKRFSSLQLTFLSTIIFGFLGLIGYLSRVQTTFTGVGTLEQQFTAVDSILFSSSLIPASENLGAAFVIAFSLIMLRIIARKINLDKISFSVISIIVISLLVGVYGYANHTLRYSASDVSLMVVFFFWAIGGLITLLTGSFIPFWIMHIMNNLFFDLGRYFSNETILVIVGILLIFTIILYVIFYRNKLLGKKNE